MQMVGRLLSALGGQGPALLVISLCAGLLIQPLAHFGYDLLPFSAFLLTLGSFLTAGLAPSEARIRLPLMALVVAWVGLALPLAAAALLSFLPLDPALRAGVLLSLLAPPVGSAAAIAGMLGLRTRLALLVSIALTLLTPISIPCFATVLGLGIEFEMGALAIRLFSIIGAAGLVAFLAIRFRRNLMPVLPDQHAATGVAVIGLIIVGLATSQGIRTHWISNPLGFDVMLAAAIVSNFGLCVLATLTFARMGLQTAGTIGLVSGNRNVTLVWAAASFGLPSLAEGYVAACVIPVLALPLIVKLCLKLPSFSRLLPQN
jgi:predicted Na+-dependent transporter